MKKKCYEAPDMEIIHVELEKGFMKASIFEPEDGHDKGVFVERHEFGNYGDYFDGKAPQGSGLTDDQWNSWDN